ncbi:MAG TPA: hypothetical protein VMU30_02520 [Bacteroidota bacterium]|nr:hypothetical protein [Bacteroidota bacterium]
MEEVDVVIQDANVLIDTAKKHPAGEGTDGINADATQGLIDAHDDMIVKNTAQVKAVKALNTLTEAQETTLASGLALIRKVQNAGKSVYGEKNKPMMKLLDVGGDAPTSVKKMTTKLSYMKAVTADKLADLKKGGVKDSDLAQFDTIAAELTDNDVNQEEAKKAKKAATLVRDEALDTLKKAVRKVRNNAKSVFADNASVLIEFEPVTIGRGSAKAVNDKKAKGAASPAETAKK